MFGRMMVTPIAQVGADADLQTAISSLLRAAEHADVVRWIEFPNSVVLFLLVPGDPESGLSTSWTAKPEPGTPSTSTISSMEGTA